MNPICALALRSVFAVYLALTMTSALWATVPAHSQIIRNHRATLQVGMWTLWHDRSLALSPVASGGLSIESCSPCSIHKVRNEVSLHAAGSNLEFEIQGRIIHANRVQVAGEVRLRAHNESQDLSYPVRFSASDGVLVIAVDLPVERYVERVVASESGPDDSEESLKALAVVVRSFALHQSHGHTGFDLCDSTHCQLLHWGSNLPRQAAAHRAVLATAGETLWFRGRRAEAYFGKDCGGVTASPGEIWPRTRAAEAYLPSRADSYCTRRGGNSWASTLRRSELSQALSAAGLMQPGWQSLTVARRGQSGRALTVKIDGSEISAEEFRLAVGEALGWNKIPSTWFEVSKEGDQFLFHGRGWGNGVGLCQKGVAEMGTWGKGMREILQQYFPGTAVADEETGRTWIALADEDTVSHLLLSIDQACGMQLDSVLEKRRRMSAESGRLEDLVPLGSLLADLGEFAEADRTYSRALQTYQDVSPFAFAWVCFQLGVLWGELVPEPELNRAAQWYRKAIDCLPCYVKARVHLAEIYFSCGQCGEAEALLHPVIGSGDPEVAWRFADVLNATGRFAEAEAQLQAARAGFEVLLGKRLLAFADHGAEFYAGSGGNPTRAYELARVNLANRPTLRAFEQAYATATVADEAHAATEILGAARSRWGATTAFRFSSLSMLQPGGVIT